MTSLTGLMLASPALSVRGGQPYGPLYEVLRGEDALQPDEDRGVEDADWELLVQRDSEAGGDWG